MRHELQPSEDEEGDENEMAEVGEKGAAGLADQSQVVVHESTDGKNVGRVHSGSHNL